MAKLIVLDAEQLRKLAKVIYYKEVESIHSIRFNSEIERAKYLRDCRANYETSLNLLDGGAELEQTLQSDNTKASIAHDIFSYLKSCVNFSLQSVRNYTLRMSYLNKIKEHSGTLIKELRQLDPKSMANVQNLAKEAVHYNNAMLEYTKSLQNGTSRFFTKWLKEGGLKFEELVIRYQTKLGFKGSFKNLKDIQKLQVEAIIEASGRGKVVVNRLTTALGGLGTAVLLFTTGMIVWDIYSSDNKLETAVRDAAQVASTVAGAMLGNVAVNLLATRLVCVGISSTFITVTGILLGIAGGFILGAFTGWLIDLFFGSGGCEILSTDGLHCYVAPVPDGQVLARQIAHLDRFGN